MNTDNKKKLNCWEFKKCGREPGGNKEQEYGVCPSALEIRTNGIHGGINGGRCCWAVTGTFCGGKSQGSFADKHENCNKCDFFKSVITDEVKDNSLVLVLDILKKMKDNN
ncbi:MAG TPA: hypothetical protein QF753_14455 [Victivallales bacterium]|nr:hypothetical protein [Victivallales bacterium]